MSRSFEALRAQEFSRLDAGQHVYLDYTGGGLYAGRQICAHSDLLNREVFGNPHSQNPTSLASTHNVEVARDRIRAFFNADADEYEVVFTANASGALKLVGESYPFVGGARYVLTADNHNSVNGIREFARAHGAAVIYVPLNDGLRIDEALLRAYLAGYDYANAGLFAYPAQSNFSGVKHPLEWVALAREMGYDVLLDAAAFVPTNKLDLAIVRPDFVSISFYKMFGFPTGVGALIARRAALGKLRRPWFAGGTVRFASAQNRVHHLHSSGAAFEDGTLNYLSIAGVITGLDFLSGVGIEHINRHVAGLTALLLKEMGALRHSNGAPLALLYGPRTIEGRGATIAFNVRAPDGSEVASDVVEARANEQRISLRSGCFCNPGVAEAAFKYPQVQAYQCFEVITPEAFTLQQFSACMDGRPVGAVRVSLGIASNEADIHRFIALLKTFIDCDPTPLQGRSVPEYVSD